MTTSQKKPCAECPWRTDQPVGRFSAERYRALAATATDMAARVFTCHKSADDVPVVCAGAVLKMHHNMTLRLMYSHREIDPNAVSDGGHALFDDYRAMAEANGVEPDDPVLRGTR